MKLLLIVAAFNEGVKFESTCERIQAFKTSSSCRIPFDVLIVDDASTDSVPKRMSEKLNCHYLRNDKRSGIGFSLRRGYDYGLQNHYDVLAVMAGNNKDNPAELERVTSPIVSHQADFVQGSRYLAGGDFGNMPFYRLLTTRYVHPGFFSFISGQRITDSTNGFRAVSAAVLKDPRLQLHQDWLNQYELEPYLFYYAIRLKYRVMEVPVTKIYPDKKLGYSKMAPITGWWSILRPLFYLWLKIKK